MRPSEPEERASVINAASQPFEIISLLFSEVKELKRSILHFAWRSFGIENLHGILRSSISLPTWSYAEIQQLYHSVILRFQNAFVTPFTVRSNGWISLVIFVGTLTSLMLFLQIFLITDSIIGRENISIISTEG